MAIDLANLTPEQKVRLLKRVGELDPDSAQQLVGAVRQEVTRKCEKDSWAFTRYVKTRDETDEETVKPFPRHKAYVKALWDIIDHNQVVAIAKSRQTFASWCVCVYCVWQAAFKPNQHIVWQTQKEEDANKMVCMPGGDEAGFLARMQFVVRNLPPWLIGRVRESEGALDFIDRGSRIEAMPGGADKIRSKTPSLIVEDEFAFQLEAKGVHTAINPLIQKKTKVIIISTPNGAEGNPFYHVWSGKAMESF